MKKFLKFMSTIFALLIGAVIIVAPSAALVWYTRILDWPPWVCVICGGGFCALFTSSLLYFAIYEDEV